MKHSTSLKTKNLSSLDEKNSFHKFHNHFSRENPTFLLYEILSLREIKIPIFEINKWGFFVLRAKLQCFLDKIL